MNLTEYMKNGISVLLVGPPGCGKTARIHAVAQSIGMDMVTMRASLSERIDFGGCLIPDTAAGVTKTLPLEMLHGLKNTDKPTLLFVDDIGQAPLDVQAALMRLFDAGELPRNVLIWGATNRPGDKAGVSALCEPLRSRFNVAFSVPTPDSEESPTGGVMLGNWKQEVDGWAAWAMERGYPSEVIAWHMQSVGRTLYAWKPSADPALRMPDFRSWETVCRLWLANIRDLGSIAAAVGKGAASEFLAFSRLAAGLPTYEQIIMAPQQAPVPDEPAALWLVACNVVSRIHQDHAQQFVTYMERLPRIFQAFLAKSAYLRCPKLSVCPSWVKWFTANQELFVTC